MLLFIIIWSGTIGYTLVYAGIKGDNAKIDGVALWQKPWLPFLAALKGAGNIPNSALSVPNSTLGTPPVTSGGGSSNSGNSNNSGGGQTAGKSLLNGLLNGLGSLATGLLEV